MQFPNDLKNLKPGLVFKVAGLALVVIIILTLAFRLLGSSFSSLSPKASINNLMHQNAFNSASDELNIKTAEIAYGQGGAAMGLSIRNVATPVAVPNDAGVVVGDNAEAFEVTEYNASIETRRLQETCNQVVGLKSRADVIFERADQYEKSCNYYFKVKKDSVSDILNIIKGLNPKELNESTYTIKRQIDDYTSEMDILKKKMSSIEETLTNAVNAYDDITKLATRTQDVESLAKIIDSKINIIERLTQERINASAQLERLQRSKAEQLDRMEYTYFNVNVIENKFIDWKNLNDSWRAEIKSFVYDVNKVVQDITINLVLLLFVVLQYIIYLLIAMVIAKYGWLLAKRIWKK